DSLRVDAGEDRADHAVLAGCVEPLEHEEHAALALGEQTGLELREAVAELFEELLGGGLVLEAGKIAGVALREGGIRIRCDTERDEHGADSRCFYRISGQASGCWRPPCRACCASRSDRRTSAGTRARPGRHVGRRLARKQA